MHKYIEWKVNVSQIIVAVAIIGIGWYRLGEVEKRQDAQEQTFLRADVNKETTARLEMQLDALLREIENLRHEMKRNKE